MPSRWPSATGRRLAPPDAWLWPAGVLLVALLSGAGGAAAAQAVDERVMGQHAIAPLDSAEAAAQLAEIDATAKAWQLAVTRLREHPDVKALRLTDQQLAAYVAGISDLAAPRVERDARTARAELVLRLDMADAAKRLDATHRDTEAAAALRDMWKRIERLRAKLADDTKALAAAPAAGRAAANEARQKTIDGLRVSIWLAQAGAALVRQETGTTSIPVVSPEGRTRARQLVDKAMAVDPMDADAQTRAGEVLLVEDEAESAERAFRDAVRQDPSSAMRHNRLGNALYYQGRLQDAVAEFREAIRLDPQDPISHADLGDTLRAQQKVADAMAEYREAIRLDANYLSARHSLGVALASQQRVPEALAEFQEAIRIRPSSAQGHYNAAIALADLEQDEASAREWREAVRLNPNNYNAHYNLGEMLRLTGELADSAREFREYVNRAPDTPATQKNKARARTFIQAFEEP